MRRRVGSRTVDTTENYTSFKEIVGDDVINILAREAVLPANWRIDEVFIRGQVGPLAETVQGTVLSWDSTTEAALVGVDRWGAIFDVTVYEVRGSGQPSTGWKGRIGMRKDALDAYNVVTPVVIQDNFQSALVASQSSGVLDIDVTPDDITGTATTVYFGVLRGEVYHETVP